MTRPAERHEDVAQQRVLRPRTTEHVGEPRKPPQWYGTAPPPCGITRRSWGRSVNRSPYSSYMNAVVSAFS